jgi:hypothetical protein
MSKRHELRCYDYVNHPYEQVRDAIGADALGIFQRATTSAASRADALGAELRVKLGALELAADVTIELTKFEDAISPDDRPAMKLGLGWRSKNRPGLFPSLTGSLSAYALSPTETQIEFIGEYQPQLASIQRFVHDVATFLRTDLPVLPGPGDTYWIGATE